MTKVTIDRALIEQAIDVINSECGYGGSNSYEPRAIAEALRAALAEPAVAPVAYRSLLASGSYAYSNTADFFANAEPLFASPTPPAEVPLLSEPEIAEIIKQWDRGTLKDLIADTEAAVRRKAGLKC